MIPARIYLPLISLYSLPITELKRKQGQVRGGQTPERHALVVWPCHSLTKHTSARNFQTN